eukprot:5634667-Amphidinium_carterae.1
MPAWFRGGRSFLTTSPLSNIMTAPSRSATTCICIMPSSRAMSHCQQPYLRRRDDDSPNALAH